jgi:hypothetical protein
MSSYAVPRESDVSETRSLVTTPKNEKRSSTSPYKGNAKTKPLPNTDKTNLPTPYKKKDVGVVGASQILSHKYPPQYSSKNYQKALAELKFMLIGMGTFMFLVFLGWAIVLETNFTEDGEFVYNVGLIGGSLMLVALLYVFFKRVKYLRRLVTTNVSYYIHICCGATGAYLVFLHSLFDLRSINASVALVTTAFIIISGALGRYLFTLSTIVLHRQYIEIKDTEQSLFDLLDKYDHDKSLRIRVRMAKFALRCFRKPESRLVYCGRWLSIIYYGIYYYLASKSDMKDIAKKMSAIPILTRKDAKVLKRYQNKKLRQYAFQIIKMGYVNLIEQVLLHWRILHIPALYLLVLTGISHVVVVHMY